MSKIKEFLLFKKSTGRSENTIRSYNSDLSQFLCYTENKITRLLILEYINKMFGNGLSPASRCRKLSSLKEFLNYLGKSELFPKNMSIKIPKRLPVYLEKDEMDKLINVIEDKKYRIIFNLLIATGLRISELLSIKKSDVINSHIKIIRKGNKEQIIPIPEWLSKEITDYIQGLNGNHGEMLIDLCPSSINRMLKKYIQKAGINKEVSCHKLRHTFATESMNKGIDLKTLQELLGHNSINTTSIYLHTSNKSIDEKYRKIWG